MIRFLVQHNYVNCLVTTAGGIEEDLIKCLGPTFLAPNGEFNHDGAGLRRRGLNRIGNLLVPNDNYCKFEDWVMPILDQMVQEQEGTAAGSNGERVRWSPSKVIDRLGKEINDETSILYWAHKVRYTLSPGVSVPLAHSLAHLPEPNSRLLPGPHRRFPRRHDVLPQLFVRFLATPVSPTGCSRSQDPFSQTRPRSRS